MSDGKFWTVQHLGWIILDGKFWAVQNLVWMILDGKFWTVQPRVTTLELKDVEWNILYYFNIQVEWYWMENFEQFQHLIWMLNGKLRSFLKIWVERSVLNVGDSTLMKLNNMDEILTIKSLLITLKNCVPYLLLKY